MEALNRKPDLTSVKKSMEFDDGTRIDVISISPRKAREISNNKKLSNFDRGVHITAAKIRINDQPVVYDDLMDCFTSDELELIVAFANNLKEDGEDDDPNE